MFWDRRLLYSALVFPHLCRSNVASFIDDFDVLVCFHIFYWVVRMRFSAYSSRCSNLLIGFQFFPHPFFLILRRGGCSHWFRPLFFPFNFLRTVLFLWWPAAIRAAWHWQRLGSRGY